MGSSHDKRELRRPPDLEIAASARADSVRFDRRPEVDVKFTGRSVARSESDSRRENLPEEVEPGRTYTNARVDWRAAAWVENAVRLPENGEDDQDGEQ